MTTRVIYPPRVVYPVGTTSGTVAAGNDSRLSDSRTPTAHKTSHATGGEDELTPGDIGAATSGHTHGIDTLLPTQTGNNGKVLQTNGSTSSWQTPATGGSPVDDESLVVASRMFS